jgi:hypothetical protein
MLDKSQVGQLHFFLLQIIYMLLSLSQETDLVAASVALNAQARSLCFANVFPISPSVPLSIPPSSHLALAQLPYYCVYCASRVPVLF